MTPEEQKKALEQLEALGGIVGLQKLIGTFKSRMELLEHQREILRGILKWMVERPCPESIRNAALEALKHTEIRARKKHLSLVKSDGPDRGLS